ncbi:response regulator transcription factor [Synechococcus sp. Tobar12-5m-g]|uniref:response regulator transcription factor n=1 Tax=unclassified Synechococcus TaxID=2626047 RepID=UPI0020CD1866|nr:MULTISPECIES: response regulator transcription factor [unclassified Synechococcus]MCP9773508.1 response regulator transcription factor [Synechococcus sp. Tobar12-5m-g]MCP9874507.1 response regulator transcription factor [Synechococcus sp. Cruz CV-v-12]
MRALVVEDDELFRLGLEVTLQGFEVIELVTAVGDGEQALDLLRHQSFDVILLDLGLPGLGGLETCRRIAADHPTIPVLVVTSQEDPAWCLRMMRAGARGYVRKGVAAADLQLAIQTVLRGASWWDADATAALRELGTQGGPQAGESATSEADALALLTPRERQVLEAMARGLSNREIAVELGIGLGTVRVHGHAIMQKLEVANRTQAVLKLRPRH